MAERLQRGLGWRDALAEGVRDLRHAVRSLRRRPGYAITVVATLPLGIGANTAIFTVVHSVLLRPLPYAEPGRLVQLFETTPQNPQHSSSPMSYLDARQQIQSFEHLTAFRTQPRNLLGEGDPERLVVGNVSANFFATLGVDALLGRTFTPEAVQPGAARTAVLSHDLWVRRFGSDPSLLGRSIQLDGGDADGRRSDAAVPPSAGPSRSLDQGLPRRARGRSAFRRRPRGDAGRVVLRGRRPSEVRRFDRARASRARRAGSGHSRGRPGLEHGYGLSGGAAPRGNGSARESPSGAVDGRCRVRVASLPAPTSRI